MKNLVLAIILGLAAFAGRPLPAQQATSKEALQAKLKTIVIPKVEFMGVTVSDALQFLKLNSVANDKATTEPQEKGVNIIVKGLSTAKITLSLKDVPLDDALKYVTELAGLKYSVGDSAVIVERR